MNIVLNIDNNCHAAIFPYNNEAAGAQVKEDDIIFRGKAKKLQKAIKKLKTGTYNIVAVNPDQTKQFGIAVKVSKGVVSLIF